jgi:multidrug efflux pump subunit AcrB
MGIVGFALRFRHTFYVLALMMLFLGGSAILTTPKDIFPNINIPVVTVIWVPSRMWLEFEGGVISSL